jgi:hypothetical protein
MDIFLLNAALLMALWAMVLIILGTPLDVSGQLKPASNGHFLKPKTGHLEIS